MSEATRKLFSDGAISKNGDEQVLSWRIEGGLLRCVLERPKSLNALTPRLLFELAELVATVGEAPDVRVVTLEGAGAKAFSAGFDLKVLAALGGKAHEGDPLAKANNAILGCTKPTVAIVRGFCLGAGLDLAMSCDFRIATPESRFSVPALKIGTVYRPQSMEKFWRRLGSTVTKELFVVGREFTAAEALVAGIVQLVVGSEELEEAASRFLNIPDQGVKASQGHKRIIDAFDSTSDRSDAFWSPLDALREESVQSKERLGAVTAFADGHKGER
ncbi:MAG: enoyl-CoA hydratase/isomerase family protein [Ferrimicrobium sp.]